MKRSAESNLKSSMSMGRYWRESPNRESHVQAIKQANTKNAYNTKLFRGSGVYLENKFILAPNGFRRCKSCDKVKTLEEFWHTSKLAESSRSRGRSWKCGVCASTHQKLNRKPDKNEKGKRARSLKWRKANPELASARVWAARLKNPTVSIEAARRRRARKSNNGIFLVTKKDLDRLKIRQSGKCYLCSGALVNPELDHIIPIKHGGGHRIGNLGWACRKCNRDKSFRFLSEVRYGSRLGTT